MCKIVSKDAIWYSEFVLGELGPAIILSESPRASYDAGDNPPYIRINQIALAVAPASQRVSYFHRSQRFTPAPIENIVEDVRNCAGFECRMGRIKAREESIAFNGFGD
jgi:hypothetical protein